MSPGSGIAREWSSAATTSRPFSESRLVQRVVPPSRGALDSAPPQQTSRIRWFRGRHVNGIHTRRHAVDDSTIPGTISEHEARPSVGPGGRGCGKGRARHRQSNRTRILHPRFSRFSIREVGVSRRQLPKTSDDPACGGFVQVCVSASMLMGWPRVHFGFQRVFSRSRLSR